MIELIIFTVIGIVLGGVVGILLGRNNMQTLRTSIEVSKVQLENEKRQAEQNEQSLREQIDDVKKQAQLSLEESKKDAEKNQKEALERQQAQFDRMKAEADENHKNALTNLKEHYDQMKADAEESHKQQLDSQQAKFNETLAKVTAQLKTATEEMLKQRQKEFAESSTNNIGQIVNPLRETIDKMKKTMEENTLKQTSLGSEMKANIENMLKQSEAARKTADELTRAFKHEGEVQGHWGEAVLDELLEAQGLTRGIHYDTQPVIRDASGKAVVSETGSTLRPDVILHLDQRREVIIDAKVSLTAYIDYVNAQTEDVRKAKLKDHLDSINKHVKELSAKDYSSYIQPPKVKMDYVIMFIPHSGALWTAFNAQPDLWRRAMEKNVFIADEQTLFAALRIINLTWTQIAQAQNHERVFDLANEMIDRVGQFTAKYEAVGKALKQAQKAYDEGERKLSEKGQSILLTCKKLEKLGAKQSGKNPLPALLDADDIPALEAST